MFSIIDHIDYLCSEHDFVVVPGLGAFIAQYSSASFDSSTKMIIPPSRTLSFNGAICHNDGMLANSIVRREGVAYDNALALIGAETAQIKSQINSGAEVAIASLGILKMNNDGTAIEFVKPENVGRNEYFGLGAFTMPTLDMLEEEAPEARNVIYLRGLRALRSVASVAAVLVVSLFLITPVAVDRSALPDMASVSSMMVAEEQMQLPEELYIAIPSIEEGMAIADTSAVASANKGLYPIVENAKYYLIISSLNSVEAANEYVARAANNESMHVLTSKTKCRVYVASSNDFASINALRLSLADTYPEAWICCR